MDILGIIMDKIMILPGIIIALSFHEFGHAKMADMLGDSTPRSYGRVTLNPIAHIDIVGMIALLLAGFGWGKPVPIDGYNFKHQRRDHMLVSIAGVAMNFFLAFIFMGLVKIITLIDFNALGASESMFRFLDQMVSLLMYTVHINFVLMVFNLLPIPPLDGFNLVGEALNLKEKGLFYPIYQKGSLILLLLFASSAVSTNLGIGNFNIIGMVIGPVVGFFDNFAYNIFF